MTLIINSSRWSALLISLVIMTLLTIITTVFLEVIQWSSKLVQGLEASNAAYYQAIWVIEEQLIPADVNKKTPWNIAPITQTLTSTWRSLLVETGSSIMPTPSKWTSPYNDNYNIISLGQPVQIVIPDWVTWASVNFEFRIPTIWSAWTWVSLSMTNSWIILWTLGYSGASLYASWETQIFRWNHINVSTNVFSSFSGITNSWSSSSVSNFYTDTNYLGPAWSKCAPYNCTLKLSMIQPVITADWRSLPFIEYKITFNKTVPSQFMSLDATAYSYGFQRKRVIRIPQITTNTALDFAVLQ